MIDRRACLGAMIMFGEVLSACAGTRNDLSDRKKRSLFDALLIVQASQTEAELLNTLGPPNSIEIFDPGNKSSPSFVNRYSRSERGRLIVSAPPALIDTLPAGTKLYVYVFEYGPLVLNPTTGALEVGIDDRGRVVGCFYSKSLEGIEKKAGLNNRR